MAEILLVTPQEITNTSILGGNVDVDKYAFCIANTQVTVLEPLLGSILYDKIKGDFQNNTLTGNYQIIYNEFVKPILKNKAIAEYIEISSYTLANGGLFKHSPDNAEIVDKEEAQFLSGKYDGLAQMYILRFQKWICKNYIAEYKKSQDEVNARGSLNTTFGWKLGKLKDKNWYENDV